MARDTLSAPPNASRASPTFVHDHDYVYDDVGGRLATYSLVKELIRKTGAVHGFDPRGGEARGPVSA
jgi:hypothetical protein